MRYLFPFKGTVPYNYFKKNMIANPLTLGDKLRNRRLTLKLLQEDVAKIIGVCTDSITGWEKNRTSPLIQFMPAIIKFLGYNPIPNDHTTNAGKILALRSLLGVNQEGMSKVLQVDESSIRSWEQGKRTPSKRMQQKINYFLIVQMKENYKMQLTKI